MTLKTVMFLDGSKAEKEARVSRVAREVNKMAACLGQESLMVTDLSFFGITKYGSSVAIKRGRTICRSL